MISVTQVICSNLCLKMLGMVRVKIASSVLFAACSLIMEELMLEIILNPSISQINSCTIVSTVKKHLLLKVAIICINRELINLH